MAAKKKSTTSDPLATYRAKRDFAVTPEPAPARIRKRKKGLAFVVQKHDATRLHYDVRLEIEGTMMSFAVPKGPSYDPSVKRLAVETEDHPMAYNDFEGNIPEGEYGGGDVIVWDRGTYETVPPGREAEMRAKGRLHVRFFGEKLRGEWHIVRTRGGASKPQWIFFKAKDEHADPAVDPVRDRPESVLTGELLPRDRPADATRAVRRTRPAAAARVARAKKATSIDALLQKVGEVEKATLVRDLDDARLYHFELKYDGYRIVAVKSGDEVRLLSRNGKDWTESFPVVAEAVAALDVDEVVLDGELCALDAQGRPSFNLLQNYLGQGSRAKLSYALFDVLWVEGRDVRAEPIERRRALLEPLLDGAKPPLALSSVIEGSDHREILKMVCAQGLEGVIAKRKGSRYVPGRTKDWLKLKCTHRQELAIVGYLPLTGTSNHVGSLLIAYVGDDGAFHFAGKVGTGFDNATRKSLARALDAHRVDAPPVKGAPRIKNARWSRPRLVAEVEFTEWTPDGKIRHPSFLGLREDKTPRDCLREVAVAAPMSARNAPRGKDHGEEKVVAATVKLTNPDKVLYPRDGIRKRDVFEYYREIATIMVPHLAGRPLALQRWPDGIDGEAWFQQKAPPNVPAHVRLVPVADRKHVCVENAESLLWLANLAALTLHQWSSRAPASAKTAAQMARALDRPDYVVFDLDPGEGTWSNLIAVARRVRALLDELELESVVKTSGKRGLHVLVPIAREHDHEEATAFAQRIADRVAASLPEIATTERMKQKRKGRLYVDYLQNGRGKTIVAPYTLRALDGAPVSTPIEWSEVTDKLDPSKLDMKAVLRRVDRKGDLFAKVLEGTQRLPLSPSR